MEDTRVFGEKPLTCRKLLKIFVAQCYIEYTSAWARFDLTTLVMIDADRMSSCKTNYRIIVTKMAPNKTVNRYVSNISGS